MTAREKKLNSAYEEIMIALYANSEPSGDFLKLVEDAPLNPEGKKVIDFDAYQIDRKKAQEIFDSVVAKYKIKTKWDLKTLGFNIWLGASPRFKRETTNQEIQNQELTSPEKNI